MAKTRSYAKESFKSDPSGIRFNLEQEKIAFMRTGKKTRQQLVDFLLDNFVKGEKPILDRLPNHSGSPNIPHAPIISISQYESYCNEIMEAKSVYEIEHIVLVAKKDGEVNGTERKKLEELGIEQSRKVDI